MKKTLKTKGEYDYDYKYDILFFKAAERQYKESIELEDIIVDVDNKGYIIGIQILEASKFLKVPKATLLKITKWEFSTSVQDRKIKIRLAFNITIRNRIIEKNPIIMESISENLPNSQLDCAIG